MKKGFRLYTVLLFLTCWLHLWAGDICRDGVDKSSVEVFSTPTSASVPYRIPAIAQTGGGNIVAVADYRHCRADIGYGHIDLRCRISHDNGESWGDVFTIIEGDGRLVDNNPNLSLSAGYGDACLVADRESNRLLLICVCGYQTFFASTREYPNQIARLYSEDGGATWSAPEVITEQFYTPIDRAPMGPIRSMFIGSGRIHQSRYTKVDEYYRLYASMLARDKDNNFCNFVIYSDDFGLSWKVLGGVDTAPIPTGADEPKTEELPDGSILLSSRCQGGRLYNIYRFTDAHTAEGQWGEHAFSGAENNGVTALDNSCNGEVLVLPVTRNSDGEDMYLLLQSLPFGDGRTNVGIYYKELSSPEDFDTPENLAKAWDGTFQISDKPSSYSTMIQQADDAIGFLYEEDTYSVNAGGFTIVYKRFTIDEITGGKYRYNARVNNQEFIGKISER